MFSNHVSSLSSAYCHDELSVEESRRVAEHLISCPPCRAEFDEIKFGARLAAQLPMAPAPESLWNEVETVLDRNGQRVYLRARRLGWFAGRPAMAFGSLALALIAVAAVIFWFHRRPLPVVPIGEAWEVARIDGTPQIGSKAVSDKGHLGVGQWLETDNDSRARINVSDIGQVQIDPNTRVRLVDTSATEHRLELARGRLSARIFAPPRIFFVNTPSAVAADLGCAYTLDVDDAGNSLLRVTLGYVALQLKDRESIVPAGAACATRPGLGPGTPYYEDASERFRSALAKLDFEPANAAQVDIVLSEARLRDTMTLWNLLPRVNGDDRTRVYVRMVKLVPPPQGVTRDGVLDLDRDMLSRWKDIIDGDRGESIPAHIRDFLRRVHSGIYRRTHGK